MSTCNRLVVFVNGTPSMTLGSYGSKQVSLRISIDVFIYLLYVHALMSMHINIVIIIIAIKLATSTLISIIVLMANHGRSVPEVAAAAADA